MLQGCGYLNGVHVALDIQFQNMQVTVNVGFYARYSVVFSEYMCYIFSFVAGL